MLHHFRQGVTSIVSSHSPAEPVEIRFELSVQSSEFRINVILNATGVRLSLARFNGFPDYPAPALIEPGECASFLVRKEFSSGTFYEVQVFQGPVPNPNPNLTGGWTAPTGELGIPLFQFPEIPDGDRPLQVPMPATAKAQVQVTRGGDLVPSTLNWKADRLPARAPGSGEYFQYTLTQSLD